MKNRFLVAIFLLVLLTACNDSPGELEGTWKSDGLVPMTIAFRSGETESMGVIEHVDYSSNGNVITVTYKDGIMKGSAVAFTMVDSNTATNSMFMLHRVR